MTFLNPIPIVVTCFLILVALPLAFLAFVTTWLAFWILLTRLVWVYMGLAWDIFRYFIWDRWRPGFYDHSPGVSRRPSRHVSPTESPPRSPGSSKGGPTPGRRAGSMSSGVGNGSRVAFLGATHLGPTNALERDFEGLGGWRIEDNADKANEHSWESLDSRLDFSAQQDQRHHRSQTHAISFSPGFSFGSPTGAGARSGPHTPDRLTTTNLNLKSSSSRAPTRVRVEPLTNLARNEAYFPLDSSAPNRKVAA